MLTVLLIGHVFGFLSSFHALMSTRTAQGSIAWIVSLNTFPLATVPAYWVFGRNKFQGYVTLHRQLGYIPLCFKVLSRGAYLATPTQ